MLPRRFALVRHVDYTGVSGVGVVAHGVVFADGHVVLRWSSEHPATSLWNSLDDLMAVHGHGEGTSVEWIDKVTDLFGQQDSGPIQGRRVRRARAELQPGAVPDDSAPHDDQGSPDDDVAPSDDDPVHNTDPGSPSSTGMHWHARLSVLTESAITGPDAADSAMLTQRRPGRHRRSEAEQESMPTESIESDRL